MQKSQIKCTLTQMDEHWLPFFFVFLSMFCLLKSMIYYLRNSYQLEEWDTLSWSCWFQLRHHYIAGNITFFATLLDVWNCGRKIRDFKGKVIRSIFKKLFISKVCHDKDVPNISFYAMFYLSRSIFKASMG